MMLWSSNFPSEATRNIFGTNRTAHTIVFTARSWSENSAKAPEKLGRYVRNVKNEASDHMLWQLSYHIHVKYGHTLSDQVLIRGIPCNPFSETSLSTIKGWLSTCLNFHSKCGSILSTSEGPSRIIRIGEPTDPCAYLIESTTSGFNHPYAALSHCWGSEKNLTTTTSTLRARVDGIVIALMPQTFRDAIKVCQKLGLSYLWIDSLCILQDSIEDWEIESAKMASVYMNAHVTLAASRASSDVEGFLQLRKASPEGSSAAGWYSRHVLEVAPGVFLDTHNPYQFSYGEIDNSPLSKRAWVFQERQLSRRTIFFTEHELFWACNEAIAEERGHVYDNEVANVHNLITNIISSGPLVAQETGLVSGTGKMMQAILGRYVGWYRMVSQYTMCAITNPSDRLPALSGLVAFMASKTGDEYFAGIWGNAVIEGLLWRPLQFRKILEDGAPSWSWTSTEGRVLFQDCSDSQPLADVVDIMVESASKHNLFSRVISGSLLLSAPILPVSRFPRAKCNQQPQISTTVPENLSIKLLTNSYTITGYFDISSNDFTDIVVCFLAEHNAHGFYGILLQPAENSQYERVGFVNTFLYRDSSGQRTEYGIQYRQNAYNLVLALPRTDIIIT